ncbi:Diacylglycerol kinase eta [Armadillidium nasatum]|uniref:Diacylglycerol kinase eta n=1 Tax=Armadillidium nasatum TaxID=96803 RepID=A0A5N5TEN6_9CRUS|nr:Diacylglycerol kinase eta [Armadillidium nasatum]
MLHIEIHMLKLKREALRARGGQEGQVREWSPEEVANWLSKLGLAEHKEAFVNNDIRGAELLSLDRSYLVTNLYFKSKERKEIFIPVVFLVVGSETLFNVDQKLLLPIN